MKSNGEARKGGERRKEQGEEILEDRVGEEERRVELGGKEEQR